MTRSPHLSESRDQILLKDLEVSVIVGILPEERTREQPLVVNIAMSLDVDQAALSGDLSTSVDYAHLANAVREILIEGKFRLIESAAVALSRFVLLTAPQVYLVSVEIIKPKALSGLGIPLVTVTRSRADLAPFDRDGQSHVFFECPGTSLRFYTKAVGQTQGTPERSTLSDSISQEFSKLEHKKSLGLEIRSYEV